MPFPSPKDLPDPGIEPGSPALQADSLPAKLPGKPPKPYLATGRSPLPAILRITASLVAQLVKNPPAMRETWVQSLGWEDPLENGKATHSSILAWRIPQTV